MDGHIIASAIFAIYFPPFGIVFRLSAKETYFHFAGGFLIMGINNTFRIFAKVIEKR